jgi:apoptosis-inducing factor 2
MNAAVQRPSVVVIGGGYAGIGVAAALDEDADVTLVERRDTFVDNVGALRALVGGALCQVMAAGVLGPPVAYGPV